MLHLIYEKYTSGAELSDAEILTGEKHFEQLADLLYRSGSAFVISAKEANRVYIGLKSYRMARDLKKTKT